MPLDPQMQQVVEFMESLGLPDIADSTPAQLRETMRARPPLPPEAVAATEDVVLPGPGGDIPVRLYRPSHDGPLPLVIFFHGGGWVIGDIETHDGTCRALANGSGAIVASVEYRLAPEHRFPAAVDDALAATAWLAAHAGDLGADPDRVAVAGDSAGGNLAAVTALWARDRGGPALRFQLLVYPAVDARGGYPSLDENAEAPILPRRAMDWFFNHYAPDPDDWRMSPMVVADMSGLPPAMIITAEYDPLRDEGEAYGDRLRRAGVPVTVRRYDGMVHGFFGMGYAVDRANEAVKAACQALAEALGSEPARP